MQADTCRQAGLRSINQAKYATTAASLDMKAQASSHCKPADMHAAAGSPGHLDTCILACALQAQYAKESMRGCIRTSPTCELPLLFLQVMPAAAARCPCSHTMC